MRGSAIRRVALCAASPVAWCAAASPGVKDGATDAEVEAAAADCRFEAQGASLAEKARAPDNEWFIGVAPGGRRFTFRLPGKKYPRVGFLVTNMSRPAERVAKFYNGRGTAEQYIKEGKNATNWTRLSCDSFRNNEVRFQQYADGAESAGLARLGT